MAELAAIGWVVSLMINKMDKILSYIMVQYRWEKKMKKDLRKLHWTLLQIKAVFDTVNGRHTMNNSQKLLLRCLRDSIYEADDLLDEFEYQHMKKQAKVGEGTVSHLISFFAKGGKRLVLQNKLRNNLTKFLEELKEDQTTGDFVLKLAGVEENNVAEQVEMNSSRVTGSIVTEAKIVEPKDKKDEIVRLLLESTDDESESSSTNIPVISITGDESSSTNIPVISITGDGGIGKTTLAQIICNDQRIKDRFPLPLRIWIHVPCNFDKIKLTKEILQCVSKSDENLENIMNFDQLQQELRSKLRSKRFLLVLDDVWLDEKKEISENGQMWEELLAPLQDGGRGSKILVITRMKIVAEIFGVTNPISFEGLTNDEMWSLLKQYAFGNEDPNNYQELIEIGIRIAERLKGSPVTCKIVGSMLKDSLDATKWKEILQRKMPDDVISILRLSYQRLPDYLKQCFAYYSIFPKGWHFKAEQLVFLWIAQGYIETPAENDRPLVDVGMDYFNKLLCRSFFHEVKQNFDTYYVIHDLMHDMAKDVSMDECFRIDHGKQRKITQPVQHLGVVINDKDEFKDFAAEWEIISNFKNLRTLIFFKSNSNEPVNRPLSIFKELKSVRVLDFGQGQWERVVPETTVLESIGSLTHLRYLHLGYLTKCLPESLYKLYHLQVLAASTQLRFCESMTKLIKFGKLTRLDMYCLDFRVEKKGGQSMGVLKDMAAELRGKLQISYLENVTSKEEAIVADLKSMQHLEVLDLKWSSDPRYELCQGRDVEVAEGLKPPENLKWLGIDGFTGPTSPSWLRMQWMINLQTIELYNCGCLKGLPPLGHLHWLRELRIGSMDAVKRVGSEFYGVVNDNDGVKGFPSLQGLEFKNMPEWLEWCGANFPIFPCLRQLRVDNCPKLKKFPLFSSPALMHIHISVTALISCMKMKPQPSRSSWQLLGFAMESSIVPSSALLHDDILAAIEELHIKDCTKPMPAGCFIKLAALRRLTLDSWQESLAEERLPASIEELFLHNSRPALMQQIIDKVAHIPRVVLD